ncbi:mitochondrial acidic protein MAM33 [Andrographis paniculata]|uniref:mitochondrial acidic protein MAM33 n=1 Tax=Andrographis paniculata TaxID=175694 RepID=UPI0021E81FBD|nr:mitochondrial acidic protein MAM33 [Andrographis paniculata]
MPRATQILRRAHRAIEDFDLLKILESELNHELSTMRYQVDKTGSFGDFVVQYDSPQTQDVLLRKKCPSGEEVAVSALLGQNTIEEDNHLPKEALMKVCIMKPGLSSVLQFDCVTANKGDCETEVDIQSAHYIPSPSCLDSSSFYKGPVYSDLDPVLQQELKKYLAARGIEENFASSLLLHLHKKEQNQYMNWLQKLKDMMARPTGDPGNQT